MCGIAGFVGPTFSKHELRKHILLACNALRHRGPDDQQHYVGEEVALGASRLAIRDPEKGFQPMERSGLVIVFNGELYGAQPLREKLLKLGYSFETTCDTEILLNAFIEFGPSIVPGLVGMFAFAIWDSNIRTLYLARDRWGEKPLYYSLGEKFLAFASEIKALWSWPGIETDVNLEDINIFLKNSCLPSPRTGWKKILKLEPGFILTWHEGEWTKKPYFIPEWKEEKKGVEELFYLLDQSVQQCSVSDKPVGAFLSGGLDSTTVAYFLSKHHPGSPVFSLHWDDKNYSEELYARAAASALGLNHFSVKCDVSFFMTYFDCITALYDEPFADESIVPTYCLAKFAKSKVDVVLTGDGADEFFHGYERYFFKGDFKTYQDVFSACPYRTRQLICHPDFLILEPKSEFLKDSAQFSWMDRYRSWVDIQTYLPDDILTKVDRATMGVGLEARAPFLTPSVTNFALGCTREALIGRQSRGKEILRAAMKNTLPKLTIERKKMGFGVPLNDWFRSSLKEWMISRLLEGSLLKTGWFSENGIQQLIADHLAGKGNYARPIFNLLVLEAWIKRVCNTLELVDVAAH